MSFTAGWRLLPYPGLAWMYSNQFIPPTYQVITRTSNDTGIDTWLALPTSMSWVDRFYYSI